MHKVDPIELKPPPPVRPWPLGHYLWEPFNRTEHSVSLARDDEDFCRQDVRFIATNPPDGMPIPSGVIVATSVFHVVFPPRRQRGMFLGPL